MKKYLFLLFGLMAFISCYQDHDKNIYQDIKKFEFNRNPDTTYFSQLISSPHNSNKLMVAKSIGKIASESFIPLLKQLLSTQNNKIKKEAIFSIGQIGTPECEKLLIELLNKSEFFENKYDIILALGRCADKSGSFNLLKNIQSFTDSLKTLSIQNLSYIFKRNKKLKAIPDTVNNYLNHSSTSVRNAAIYFFSRNNYKPVFYKLLNTNVFTNSNTYKYKLSALSKILEKISPDSLMLDSIKTVLINKRFYNEPDWQKLIYKIKLLSHYSDSSMTIKIASYLKNNNPHVRNTAIVALGKIKSDFSKNKLLHYYDSADWSEKGFIILNLADRYPKFIYRLIQQNLDQGTLYFKEMLLKSLAKINNEQSRIQLKQFLNVPKPRLQATAFRELDRINRLYYKDVLGFLQSGNEMLTSFAAYWIGEHPKSGKHEDLISAYLKFSEPKNAETMVAIIEALNKLKNSNTIAFLDSTYLNTSHPDIARAAKEGLALFDVGTQEKDFSQFSLFVPDTMIYDSDPINIAIKTEKGNIDVELWPEDSPLTVSHFIYLIKKGYYKNLLFHRVVADFVIQGGDPSGTGWSGPGYSIPCEYNNNPYLRGSIGMATAGKDTGGSQFFICLSEQPHLNRRYTNFGIVKNGMNIVDTITKDDKILEIIINQ